jgi:hypothetical protein
VLLVFEDESWCCFTASCKPCCLQVACVVATHAVYLWHLIQCTAAILPVRLANGFCLRLVLVLLVFEDGYWCCGKLPVHLWHLIQRTAATLPVRLVQEVNWRLQSCTASDND